MHIDPSTHSLSHPRSHLPVPTRVPTNLLVVAAMTVLCRHQLHVMPTSLDFRASQCRIRTRTVASTQHVHRHSVLQPIRHRIVCGIVAIRISLPVHLSRASLSIAHMCVTHPHLYIFRIVGQSFVVQFASYTPSAAIQLGFSVASLVLPRHWFACRPGVADGEGSTGSVFRCIGEFLRRRHVNSRVKFIICENVMGLCRPPRFVNPDGRKVSGTIHQSNVACVLSKFEEWGFTPIAVQCDPRQFGHPQSRHRHFPSLFSLCQPAFIMSCRCTLCVVTTHSPDGPTFTCSHELCVYTVALVRVAFTTLV